MYSAFFKKYAWSAHRSRMLAMSHAVLVLFSGVRQDHRAHSVLHDFFSMDAAPEKRRAAEANILTELSSARVSRNLHVHGFLAADVSQHSLFHSNSLSASEESITVLYDADDDDDDDDDIKEIDERSAEFST